MSQLLLLLLPLSILLVLYARSPMPHPLLQPPSVRFELYDRSISNVPAQTGCGRVEVLSEDWSRVGDTPGGL